MKAHLRQKHDISAKDSLTIKIDQFHDGTPDVLQTVSTENQNRFNSRILPGENFSPAENYSPAEIEEINEDDSEAVFDCQENDDSYEDIKNYEDENFEKNKPDDSESVEFQVEEIEESETFCQECPECFEQFENKDQLDSHLRVQHELVRYYFLRFLVIN